ncbi:hypothetical protein OG2516_12041 [Oceanicola granulosus HTCC2516]|uniref:Asparaginase n=1 Tax=Oceanicola granulosus (strain ATCC BAA-861 / DSM 15982 / KCTC 12143 / HTCC2516) TaxID=314256 RepID=Q2CBB6_OCEGH|nr:asparaginase [Oceanicola granulosus]EAR49982.1 hypothetical protein OG2516_12041 [Oceanicola granulosus HTCC2516]
MTHPAITDATLVELTRNDMVESVHRGHAVVVDDTGGIVEAWGAPDTLIYPRSSCKMIQALPLAESGLELSSEQLALACASHQGAHLHAERVGEWLAALGLGDDDLRCGPETPRDDATRRDLICSGDDACQVHNNCSGKHAGFLALEQRIGGGPEYVELDHPVQRAVRQAFEEVTEEVTPGYGIDGCSAPNFPVTLLGLARAMGAFACAGQTGGARDKAMVALREAMVAHPELVAGEGRACTELMRAMDGRVAIKTGAEGVFVAIVPEKRLGVALKITDGTTRASECAIARILVGLGVLDAAHPLAQARLNPPLVNRRGLTVGEVRAAF